MLEQECDICARGGHCVGIDLEDAPYCSTKCRGCKKVIRIHSQRSEECCGHSYIGEDLFAADEYYGAHDDY